ncbi:hypothetical protein [Thermoanaerobacterium thermosulfurigenes]
MAKTQTLEDKIRKWKKQAKDIEKELQKRERKAGRFKAKKKNA